jgi:negative regulator of flagellin synthesis FlgM
LKINEPGRVGNVHLYKKTQEASQVRGEGKLRSKDEVQISSEAKALLESQKTDLHREEKIDALKKAVQDGTYQVDARQIAQKLLQNFNQSE